MGNLRAEQRVDVNGKLVTRHVRDGATQAASRSAIPAPGITSKPSITKARRPIYADIMILTGVHKLTAADWGVVRNNLVHLSDDELGEVRDVMDRFSGDLRSVPQNFMKVAIRNGHALEAARLAKSLCEAGESAGFTDSNRTFGGVLLGAVEMKMLDEDDWSAPEGRAANVKARLLVTQAILESMPDSFSESVRMSVMHTFTLKDYELGNLIDEDPERYPEIIEAIQSRQTTDTGMIRELMDHDVKSLTSGVL
jgi:hypothetical protein